MPLLCRVPAYLLVREALDRSDLSLGATALPSKDPRGVCSLGGLDCFAKQNPKIPDQQTRESI
jgi:hypothetical protein